METIDPKMAWAVVVVIIALLGAGSTALGVIKFFATKGELKAVADMSAERASGSRAAVKEAESRMKAEVEASEARSSDRVNQARQDFQDAIRQLIKSRETHDLNEQNMISQLKTTVETNHVSMMQQFGTVREQMGGLKAQVDMLLTERKS